jgi:chromosome segregation ATPase
MIWRAAAASEQMVRKFKLATSKSLDATQNWVRHALHSEVMRISFGRAVRPRASLTGSSFEEVCMMEVELSGPEQTRIQQAADEALRVLTGHEGDHPPPMQIMAEVSLPNADPQVGQLRRRFFAIAIGALAAAIFISLYFDVIASQLFEQTVDKSIPRGKTTEAATAELHQEVQNTAALTSELAPARSDFEYLAELLRDVLKEKDQLRKSAEAATAELQQERQKTAALTSELATTRSDFETKLASSSTAADEVAQLKKSAETATAELQQERQKTAALTSELATTRSDFETKLASSSAAADEVARLRKSAEAATAELQQERQKTAALTSELATTRSDFETKLALSSQADDEAAQLTAELQRERQRTAALTSRLATTRSDFETKLASSTTATDEVAQLKKSEETATAELQQERQKTVALTSELFSARRDFETKLALSSKAADKAVQLKKSMEAVTAELQQERQKNAALMHRLDSAQPAIEAPTAPDRIAKGEAVQAKPIAASAATSGRKVDPEGRLMARANELLAQGNISGARIVLERAMEMGSAGASFAIAETYDPRVLSGWKAYGTRGDAAKAREFYAKAAAAGIEEAKDRLELLRE